MAEAEAAEASEASEAAKASEDEEEATEAVEDAECEGFSRAVDQQYIRFRLDLTIYLVLAIL